jgi:hypothetical protein
VGKFADKALAAKRESKYVEFKAKMVFDEPHTWCEVSKDFAAMANSGGGAILVGVSDDGSPSGEDVSQLLELDSAVIADRMHKYTGVHVDAFEVSEHMREGVRVAVVEVASVDTPLVFTKQGAYVDSNGKHKTAFSVGTVYFRHGAKSEPGTTADIEASMQRRLKTHRKELLSGLKAVVDAPVGATVVALAPGQEVVESTEPRAVPVRITNDPKAPAYRKVDYDVSHPYRQTELIAKVNERLGSPVINSYDIQCVKNAYEIADNETYCHQPKFSSPQYSPAFVDWLASSYRADKRFFERLRRDARA